jgi:hypothetical protein
MIDYSRQTGPAFKVENAILTLTWLRTFEGFPRSIKG